MAFNVLAALATGGLGVSGLLFTVYYLRGRSLCSHEMAGVFGSVCCCLFAPVIHPFCGIRTSVCVRLGNLCVCVCVCVCVFVCVCVCEGQGCHSLMRKLEIPMCSMFQRPAEATSGGVYDLHIDSVPPTNRGSCPWFPPTEHQDTHAKPCTLPPYPLPAHAFLAARRCPGRGLCVTPNHFNKPKAFAIIQHFSTAMFALQQCLDLRPMRPFPPLSTTRRLCTGVGAWACGDAGCGRRMTTARSVCVIVCVCADTGRITILKRDTSMGQDHWCWQLGRQKAQISGRFLTQQCKWCMEYQGAKGQKKERDSHKTPLICTQWGRGHTWWVKVIIRARGRGGGRHLEVAGDSESGIFAILELARTAQKPIPDLFYLGPEMRRKT